MMKIKYTVSEVSSETTTDDEIEKEHLYVTLKHYQSKSSRSCSPTEEWRIKGDNFLSLTTNVTKYLFQQCVLSLQEIHINMVRYTTMF